MGILAGMVLWFYVRVRWVLTSQIIRVADLVQGLAFDRSMAATAGILDLSLFVIDATDSGVLMLRNRRPRESEHRPIHAPTLPLYPDATASLRPQDACRHEASRAGCAAWCRCVCACDQACGVEGFGHLVSGDELYVHVYGGAAVAVVDPGAGVEETGRYLRDHLVVEEPSEDIVGEQGYPRSRDGS